MAANSIYNNGGANLMAFGQHGSVHIATTGSDFEPPPGLVFVAIQCLANTTFTQLEANDTSKYFGTDTASPDPDLDGVGDTLTTSTEFPAGITFFGRWDKIDLASGKVIAYFGP